MMKNGVLLLLLTIILACNSTNQKKKNVEHEEKADSIYVPTYANKFKIKYFPDHKEIIVEHPWDSTAPSLITFLSEDEKYLKKNPQAIQLPVKKWVSFASTQISYANKLNVLEQLVGMAEPEYVSNPIVKKGIEDGSIKNIGTAFAPDTEILLALNPDMMMISPFKDDFYDPLRNAGMKIATNCSYLENTPLGRVEWLVYVAAFFNKEKEAIKSLKEIASRYNRVKQLAKKAKEKPTVFTGKTYQGVWYTPAADSYKAIFLKDASVDYIFNDRQGTGSLHLDFETVYEAASKCDFWTILVNYKGNYSYSVLKNEDVRYADFDAFKNRKVIYSNTNYSSLYEKGLLEPDIVLADLIKLFHPDLMLENEFVYYKKLTKEK